MKVLAKFTDPKNTVFQHTFEIIVNDRNEYNLSIDNEFDNDYFESNLNDFLTFVKRNVKNIDDILKNEILTFVESLND